MRTRARYRGLLVAGGVLVGSLGVGGAAAGGRSLSSVSCVWKSYPVPLRHASGLLPRVTAVAASSSRDVFATGLSTKAPPTFLHWDGSRWRAVKAPGQPSAVAARKGDVWAVGRRNGRPVSLRWDGKRWRVVAVPVGVGSTLDSVAVSGSGQIWATGGNRGGSALILHRSGANWSRVVIPDGAYGVTAVAAIPGTGDAWVESSDIGDAPLDLDRWMGSSWQINRLFVPAAELSLGGPTLAASSESDAWVGATETDNQGHNHPLLVHWDGTTWAAAIAPNPGGNSQLNGISDLSASDAWAVGTYTSQKRLFSFVLHWDGTRWGRVPAPTHVHRQHPGHFVSGDNAVTAVPGSNQVWVGGGTLDRGECR